MNKLLFVIATFISFYCFSVPTGTYGSCREVNKKATKLKIIETEIKVNGKTSKVYEILEKDGSRIIRKEEGECFNLVVENHTRVPTGLHWHGLILPNAEDGVPYVTQYPIAPGASYPYNFEVVQSGTFWAHSHYGLQEQKLMGTPLILTPKGGDKYTDAVFFFEGFTFKSIEDVWLGLRKSIMKVMKTKGADWVPPFKAMTKHTAHSLNDVNFDAFLTNRQTIDNAPVQIVKPCEKVRVRLINGSVSSGFHINLGKLKGEIIAVDGNDVEPISFSEFPIATAQRVDVLVTIPKEGGAFPIIAQAQGTNMLTAGILKTKKSKAPELKSTSNYTVGAITNNIEKDLRALKPLAPKKVDRVLNVSLEGNMKYYVWAMNDNVWPNDKPYMVKEGERVEIVFTNNSAMAHPMHLHGHVFQVVEIDGDSFDGALRDTILVMPTQTVKVRFDANNPGVWAFHCHIAYHAWAGMFSVLLYEGFEPIDFGKKVIVDYTRIYGGY